MIDNNYFRRWFLIIFALFCVGINVVAYVLYEKNQTITDSKQWISHTYEVITEEYKLFSTLQDMQTTQRSFLITGAESFLKPYAISRTKIKESSSRLSQMVIDNPAQVEEVKNNEISIQKFMELLEQQIEIKKTRAVEVETIDFVPNKTLIDEIRERHEKIIANEQNLLQLRTQTVLRHQKNYVTTLFTTAGLSAFGLLIANALVAFLTFRRKTAEEDLLRMNKEMEGFTYIASHDLRSPLVNLKGFATEMRYSLEELIPILEKSKDQLPEKEGKKALEIVEHDLPDALRYIHSSVEKMDKLTNAILELSRIGRRNIEFRTIETERVVKHVLDTLHHTIESQKIDVKILPLPTIVADQLSIEQVFANIIDNAIKYMDPSRPGKIEIGGVRSYRETKFWVRDNGRGIDGGDMQKIFEIYRRAGNTQDIPGEGMGMAYVRTTLRRLGGQIWCESIPKVGTTFYFTISNSLNKGAK